MTEISFHEGLDFSHVEIVSIDILAKLIFLLVFAGFLFFFNGFGLDHFGELFKGFGAGEV